MKTKLKAPTKDTWLFPVEAVYGKDKKPVCGLCWSRFDPNWGKNRGGNEVEVEGMIGAQEQDPYLDSAGEPWMVWKEAYKCVNPACDARSTVRYLPAKLSFENPYHPADVKAHPLPKAAYKEHMYSEGVYLGLHKDGTYKSRSKDLGTRGVEIDHQDPWVFICPGDFTNDIPDTWTRREDGWIKVNGKSRRFEEISKWFKARRIDLSTL